MKEIILEEIIKSYLIEEKLSVNQWDAIEAAMREACEKTVDLCAENLVYETLKADYDCSIHINQMDAIRNTKSQIK